jgi:hypothetical protein
MLYFDFFEYFYFVFNKKQIFLLILVEIVEAANVKKKA